MVIPLTTTDGYDSRKERWIRCTYLSKNKFVKQVVIFVSRYQRNRSGKYTKKAYKRKKVDLQLKTPHSETISSSEMSQNSGGGRENGYIIQKLRSCSTTDARDKRLPRQAAKTRVLLHSFFVNCTNYSCEFMIAWYVALRS